MNSSTLDLTNIWVLLLCATVMIATVTATVVGMFMWTQRPTKKDALQQFKLHQRLSQIMQEPVAQPKKFA